MKNIKKYIHKIKVNGWDKPFKVVKVGDVLKLIKKEYKCDPQGLYYNLIKKIQG